MKILLVSMRHTYGESDRELSFEYFNFYLVLISMGHEVELFDYMSELRTVGKAAMNNKLLDKVRGWRPHLTLFSLFTNQFDPLAVDALRKYTKTFCFFHDDIWRVEFSRYWAKYFDYHSTTDFHGEFKYKEIGLPNAIYFPFGCNEHIFRNLNLPKRYDVSFVGAWHPWRQWLINRIRMNGIKVEVAGFRWPKGEISQEDMVRTFNESRINLNLSNSPSWDFRFLTSSPRSILNRIRSPKTIEQIKARIFEISGCGSFQLTYFVEGLASCYEIDREISVYTDADDLIRKIKFYLLHEDISIRMADAARQRTLSEHTYNQRFISLFQRMRLLE